jgi:putative ABC transport system permease protein
LIFHSCTGTENTALKEPNSIIITEDLAKRIFNSTDVLGKTLKYGFMDPILKITGVIKNHPSNSSFDFNNVVSDLTMNRPVTQAVNDWLSNNFTVYILLKPLSNPEIVSQKLKDLVLTNFKPAEGTTFSFSLQPLKDLHLKSEHIIDGARNSNVEAIAQGNPLYIKIFSYIALFVLLIAGINYMNLSTARATSRIKEIGIRKSIGAVRGNLIIQFLFEAIWLQRFPSS